MANPCPKCNNELRPDAKFCDSCGAPVEDAAAAAPSPPGAPAAPGAVNWKAILVLVVVIAVLGWLLFGNNKKSDTTMAGDGGNPHATGDMANPHGGMDSGAGMGDVTNQIADAKASLEQNPLDTQSLATLYQMFGMIGRQSQVTPYVEKALATLEEQKDSLGEEKLDEMLRSIVSAALGGNDIDGGLMALERYAELDPGNVQTLAMLGNLNYDLGNHSDSIKWYDEYIEAADPALDSETYWNVKTDRATMFLKRFEAGGEKTDLETAISEFNSITSEQPAHWGAWFNLGLAQVQAEKAELAETAFAQAKALAGDPMQIWQTEVELAKLRGEEPPPPPGNEGNPHGGMDMGGMGSAESMPNPHGGMGGA